MNDERDIDRRGFLRTATVAAAAVLVAEWQASRLAAHPAAQSSGDCITDAATLAPGEARALALGGTPDALLVVRLDAETVVAYDRRCPHLGCPVLWSKDRRRFECPCHSAAFEASSGRVLQGPPRRGLEPVAIELRGTEVRLRPQEPQDGRRVG